jgi:hypothetical protein
MCLLKENKSHGRYKCFIKVCAEIKWGKMDIIVHMYSKLGQFSGENGTG